MPLDHMEELYDSKNPVVRWVHVQRLDEIVKRVPKGKGLKILDAGCGEGHLLEKLKRSESGNAYYGVDVTPEALGRAKERCPESQVSHANLVQTGFPDNFFDVVTCTEVIEHVYEYKAVLEELRRILKPGGILILTFPNEILWTVGRFFLGRRPLRVPDHVNAFFPGTMKRAVKMGLAEERHLPFCLPFLLSLSCLMIFSK